MKYLTFLLILISNLSFAQGKWELELGTGAEVGYWYSNTSHTQTRLALSNSGVKASLPFKLGFFHKLDGIYIGPELKNQFLFIKELKPSIDPGSIEKVSNGSGVDFTSFLFTIKAPLIKKEQFKLNGNIGIGTFIENSTHQEESSFNSRFAYRIGLQAQFIKDKTYFYFSPNVAKYIFKERQIKHNVFAGGIEFGIGFFR